MCYNEDGDNMLDGFLKYLSTQKRYSAKTIENYNLDLTNFINFFDGKDIRKLEYDDFRNYLEYMYNNKYASKTISRHISSLKSFYKYLLNNNYIKENPTLLLSSPKQEFRLPNYLNPIELEKIMETPDTSTIIGKRDILILEMFYATGIRLAELINIKVSDIDKSNRMIKILGKGSKERYVFFTTKCLDYLNDYLDNSRSMLCKNSEYLFVNQKGNKLTESGVEYIINKIFISSGINVHLTPHVLRHTFATHMLNEGADLMTVKELLGHSNISTTGIYTHVSNEQLRNTYLNAHPRARRK